MLLSDDIDKKGVSPLPALTAMLPADGPAVHVPLLEKVLPDVSCTTEKALPSEVSSTETLQLVETQ
jgi:hypothetical protein